VRTFDGGQVFPLAEDLEASGERRHRIAAGGQAAVDEILGHLRALPL
jgi:hypothetical protein